MTHRSAAAATLGCKVNQYETDALLAALAAHGYQIKAFTEPADIYVINTCSVTQTSDKKSRQLIRKAHRQNPQAIIVVCGCFAETRPDEAAQLEGVRLVLGTKNHDALIQALENLAPAHVAAASPQPENPADTRLPEPAHTAAASASPHAASSRTRAYVKIQDGCDRFCTYCIVPYARGPVKSRPPESVLAEVQALTAGGCREIVLAGIHVASYGKDLCDGSRLPDLLLRINRVEGLSRIRLSSLDPCAVDDAFLAAARALPTLCGHFHLSLQSGCDRTLANMNRRYTTAQYAEVVSRITACKPDAAFTTDMIVGFPGETEADFLESLHFAESIGFARIHVFPYSPRKGTPAAAFPHPVSEPVKAERSQQMRALSAALTQRFCMAHLGRIMPVLFESETEGQLEGHTENYITVRVRADGKLINQIHPVRLMHCENGIVYGEI